MICLFCNMPEIQFTDDAKSFVCSWCTQVLLSMPQEKLRAAYKLALEIDMPNKAKAIETFLEEEEQDVRKAKKSKRNFIREGPVRMVRPTLNKIRSQSTTL